MKSRCIAVLAVFVFVIQISHAQTSVGVTPDMRQQANSYYQASDWSKSAAAYEKIVILEDTNANAQYRLGNSLVNLDKEAEALPHLAKAFSIAPNSIYALTLARAYARTGNKVKAFEAIEKSLAVGGISPEKLADEKDFSAWKGDAQFVELVKKSDLAVNPCKASPEFRQFDFWIGEWDVKNPQGQPAGSSSVQLILGQCIIFENWSAGAGGEGKSFNIFDKTDGKWHQTWVSDKGVFTHYVGGYQDGKMVLVADTNLGGKKTLAKMTFSRLARGDVRQFGENSTDDGKTWTTAFDLIYSHKK